MLEAERRGSAADRRVLALLVLLLFADGDWRVGVWMIKSAGDAQAQRKACHGTGHMHSIAGGPRNGKRRGRSWPSGFGAARGFVG